MRSQARGDATLVRCSCPAGDWDLSRDDEIDALYDLQKTLCSARVCAMVGTAGGRFEVRIEDDRLLHTTTTQPEEVLDLIRRTTEEATILRLRRMPSSWLRPRKINDSKPITRMLEKNKANSWRLIGHQLTVQLTDQGRQQKLWLGMIGEDLVIRTMCLSALKVTSDTARWRELACIAWKRNLDQEVVSFGFDARDRLIGQVRHPYACLNPSELALYLQALSTECDRLEYLLTGEDVF